MIAIVPDLALYPLFFISMIRGDRFSVNDIVRIAGTALRRYQRTKKSLDVARKVCYDSQTFTLPATLPDNEFDYVYP